MKYISELKKQKSNTVNIILYSVILGVMINIISDSLGEMFETTPIINILIGVIFTVILISLTLIYNIFRLNKTINYKGTFIVDEKNSNELITIPNYKISEDMKKYLDSAFSENEAIKILWQNGKFMDFEFVGVGEEKRVVPKASETACLLIELLEYCVLNDLSVFICDYFNSQHLNKNVITLDQNSIPDILLKNRFLKLFSESPQNRSAFIYKSEPQNYENVVLMRGKNGATYRRFNLNLPKGSKVYRSDKNTIKIDTKLFVLTIKVMFGGFRAVLDYDLCKYYIHKEDAWSSAYQFDVEINVKYKLSSIIKIYDWKYYNWLDTYLERLNHYCSIEAFLKDIGWEDNKTLIRVINNKMLD